jgi:5'-3' exonuclease
MNKTHLLVDFNNLMYRARYGIGKGDVEDIVSSTLAVTLSMLSKAFKKFKCTHMVVAVDSSSWRKSIYPAYKATRKLKKTPKDMVIDKAIHEMIDNCSELFGSMNCTFLRVGNAESDDLIAQWVFAHPDHDHIILSSDSDYKQLVSPKVRLFNGMNHTLWTLDGVYYQDGLRPLKHQTEIYIYDELWKQQTIRSSKGVETFEPVMLDPAWALYEKIMRGDVSDNIPRAAPRGIRTEKLVEAFQNKGKAEWINLMSTSHPDGTTVEEAYERNAHLIDLSYAPNHIVDTIADEMVNQITKPATIQVGRKFLEFCGTYRLVHIASNAQHHAEMFVKKYDGDL